MFKIQARKLSLPDQPDIARLIAGIGTSELDVCLRSAAALEQLCRGIITGEGSTTCGRVHFSRTIDTEDTTLCRRILALAGRGGQAVTRPEADAMFEIHAAGRERLDGGLFDALLARAVMHHVLRTSGFEVPPRGVALDQATSLEPWIPEREIKGEAERWLGSRLCRMHHAGIPPRRLASIVAAFAPEDETIARFAAVGPYHRGRPPRHGQDCARLVNDTPEAFDIGQCFHQGGGECRAHAVLP
jgi:hypothetical protein